MARITAETRRQIIAKMDGKRAAHRRMYAAGHNGQPVSMNHKADLVDVLVSMGFEVEAMSRAQIDGLMVEWDNLEAREVSNTRIGLPDRRVAMAPTYRPETNEVKEINESLSILMANRHQTPAIAAEIERLQVRMVELRPGRQVL